MKFDLKKKLKPGYLVNRKILYSYGLSRPDVDYYLRAGVLVTVARGVYQRNNDYALDWMELVASLPELGFEAHVGGASAIREAGLEHFVDMSNQQKPIHLYSHKALPGWLRNKSLSVQFNLTKQNWLSALPNSAFRRQSFGQWDREIQIATLELALFEQLIEAKIETDIVAIDRQLEGMANLSPARLNLLLGLCPNVKAKRLFGWLATRHNHAWVKHVKWDEIDLGAGKRSIIQGGRYNNQWQITVPREMEDQTSHGL